MSEKNETNNVVLKILKRNQEDLQSSCDSTEINSLRLDDLIKNAESLAKSKGIDFEDKSVVDSDVPLSIDTDLTWEDLTKEVQNESEVEIGELLTNDEVSNITTSMNVLRNEFDQIHQLDKWDWAVAGAAGIIAALVDVFLIGMPEHKGLMGGASSEGGPLSNFIREKMSNISPEKLSELENSNNVLYDPSINKGLNIEVPGMNPRNHRLLSAGHDPLLGFLFGTRDVMNGTFSAVGTDGSWIVQDRLASADPSQIGLGLFQALGKVLGHLRSDNPTTMGLPVPFMFLTQFVQGGSYGPKGRSFAEVCQAMYSYGHYDFRHFMSMSVSPLIIEVIVRSYYAGRCLYEGKDIKESLPLVGKPKLGTMLFTAHSVAAAANAGKVILSENPLSINYSQWITFFRYLIPQLKCALLDKPSERFKYVQKNIDEDWTKVDAEIENLWSKQVKKPFKF